MSDRPSDIRASSTDARSSAAEQSQPQSVGSITPVESVRSARTFELPPLPPPSVSHHASFPAGPSRSASFSSILNPNQTESSAPNRRRKVSELSSPLSRPQLPPLDGQTIASQSPRMATAGPFAPSVQGRRILTPRSPSLHRAASLNQLNAPTASIDAQVTPFPNSPRTRTYTVEPGRAGVPHLPVPGPSARSSYALSPPLARTRSSRDERARSSSLSPRSNYITNFPPASRPEGGTGSAPYQPYGPESDQSEGYLLERRVSSIPVTSSGGQNSFQMMTLQTTSGAVQLPVEVQAASRVADEKRKRNAGASARFRARRKEKEKESSHTIAKLEMQVKHLSEDAEFYRRESGYLAGIVLQMPGGERHFPRPQSPRHHRPSISMMVAPSRSTSAGYLSDTNAPPSPDGRHVRRRTSTMSMADAPSMGYAPPAHYDMPPLHHTPMQAMSQGPSRPSLPGPAALLAPAQAPAHPQYAPGPPPPGWQSYASGPPSAGPSEAR